MGQEAHHVDGEEIKEGDVSAHQQHGDDDDEGGVPEFLVLPEPALAVVPRPLHLRQFRADLMDVGADLHGENLRNDEGLQCGAGQEGLEPPTNGFGDRYSTN